MPCGHDGHAGVNLDGALDGLDVVELHHVLHVDGVFLQDSVQRLAGGDVRLEADELLAVNGFEPEALVLGERMLRVADQHQRVLAQRADFQLAVARRIGHQAQVHDVAQHVFVHLVGAAVFDVHVDRRVALEELLQVGRQVVQADAVNGGDADGAGDDVLDLLQLAVQGVVGGDDLLAVIVEHLAFPGEAELLLAALDQQRFEEAFERADLLAHRRLGDFVDLRGLGETLGFGQVAKDFQTLDLHKNTEYADLTKASQLLFSVHPAAAGSACRACLTLSSSSWLVNGFCR